MQIHIKWKYGLNPSLHDFIDLVIDQGHTINTIVVTRMSEFDGEPLEASIIATKREG